MTVSSDQGRVIHDAKFCSYVSSQRLCEEGLQDSMPVNKLQPHTTCASFILRSYSATNWSAHKICRIKNQVDAFSVSRAREPFCGVHTRADISRLSGFIAFYKSKFVISMNSGLTTVTQGIILTPSNSGFILHYHLLDLHNCNTAPHWVSRF